MKQHVLIFVVMDLKTGIQTSESWPVEESSFDNLRDRAIYQLGQPHGTQTVTLEEAMLAASLMPPVTDLCDGAEHDHY